jgi:hypothetical protein
MTERLTKTIVEHSDLSAVEAELILEFLRISSQKALSGPALEDRLLTSLALFLHKRSVSH